MPSEYWIDGLPCGAPPAPGEKYWLDGLPEGTLPAVGLQTITGSIGIASTAVFGSTAVVAGPITGIFGLAPTNAFGVGGILAGPIAGTFGLPSTVAFGADGVVVSALQVITGNAGIASTVVFGIGGVVAVTQLIVGAAGIASTATFGATGVIVGMVIGLGGLASTVGFGTTGAVLLTVPGFPLKVFINGVDWTAYVSVGSLRITMDIGSPGSRSTAQFNWTDKVGTAGVFPAIDDDIVIYYDADRIFAGTVESVRETAFPRTPARLGEVQCNDYGVILDRRVVSYYYPLGIYSTVWAMVGHIAASCLDGSGIAYAYGGTVGEKTILAEHLFNHSTVTEALNEICDEAGLVYRVDFWKVLRVFTVADGMEAAPFNIIDNDGNCNDLSIARTRGRYWNRVGARAGQDVGSVWTDSFEGDGANYFFVTQYMLASAPIVKVDGVEQTIVSQYEVAGSGGVYDWIYMLNGHGIVQNQAHPRVPIGSTITVQYPSPLSYIVWAEDEAGIALYGKFEQVVEARDVVRPTTLQAVAEGVLDKHKVIPETVEIRTRRIGLLPGQVISINTSRPAINSDYLVQRVTLEGMPGSKTQLWCRAGCSNASLHPGSAARFYQELIRRSKLAKDRVTYTIRFVLAGTVEGYTNPGLSVGVKSAIATAEKDGIMKECRLTFKSVDDGTPTTLDIWIDVYQNGVSIFGTSKLKFPAAATGTVTRWWFSTNPLEVDTGGVFTLEILAADPVAMDGILELTVQG